MAKCMLCGRRPARVEGRCAHCQAIIEAEARRKRKPQPWRYVAYRGNVVGFYPNGGDRLIPRLVNRDPAKLPKSRLINLDAYCQGFTRQQVKKMKAAVLAISRA